MTSLTWPNVYVQFHYNRRTVWPYPLCARFRLPCITETVYSMENSRLSEPPESTGNLSSLAYISFFFPILCLLAFAFFPASSLSFAQSLLERLEMPSETTASRFSATVNTDSYIVRNSNAQNWRCRRICGIYNDRPGRIKGARRVQWTGLATMTTDKSTSVSLLIATARTFLGSLAGSLFRHYFAVSICNWTGAYPFYMPHCRMVCFFLAGATNGLRENSLIYHVYTL